jgi:hypothetical protein
MILLFFIARYWLIDQIVGITTFYYWKYKSLRVFSMVFLYKAS